MKFSVFQFNNGPINEIYYNTRMNPTAEAIEKAWSRYSKVAEIEADSLEQVFEIGNIGPEENITRLQPMSSISVGDVIANDIGMTFFVAPIGFKKLPVRMYQLPADYDIQL